MTKTLQTPKVLKKMKALKEDLHGAAKKVAMHVHCPMMGCPLVQEVLNHAIGLGVNDEGEGHSG